jgi:predicted nucleotidyltransferase component of viral defense system
MIKKLHYNTLTQLQLNILKSLMQIQIFSDFRLVGGTSLSLQIGHRMSVDIDLFSDVRYGSIDFEKVDQSLHEVWPYVDSLYKTPAGMGKSYFVGLNKDDCIKLDLYYTDQFITDCQTIDHIRLASVEEIIAMKMDVIARGGRKKDFWDLHALMNDYTLNEMMMLYKKRYPFTYNTDLVIRKLTDYTSADQDFDPVCLYGKHWEIIKLDLIEFAKS